MWKPVSIMSLAMLAAAPVAELGALAALRAIVAAAHAPAPRRPGKAALYGADVAAAALVHAPVAVAFESLFIGSNPRTIMAVCQARGAALAVCGTHGISCTEYAPTQVKATVCGFGGAAVR